MRQLMVILGIIMFVFIGGLIIFAIPWGGRGDKKDAAQTKLLTDFADSNAKVTLNVRGRVVNDKEHRQLQITVGNTAVQAIVYQGYQNTILDTYQANNNVDAYRTFLSALLNSGFTNKQEARKGISIEGACSNGFLYEFDVSGDDLPKVNRGKSWATSCSVKDGTFAGSIGSVTRLFEDQVVDYNDFVNDTGF